MFNAAHFPLKVLLTGATGFIGSHVARLLLRQGCEVAALLRPGSDSWRLADALPALQVVHGDFQQADELKACLQSLRPDACVHLAWAATVGQPLSGAAHIEALQASLSLALQLADVGCQKLLTAGTCFEYNTSLGYLSERSATKPHTLYGASKLALHTVLQQLGATTGMNVSHLRFFYLYGPREDERRLVPSVMLALLKGEAAKVTRGEQVRDYLHVEDAAQAVWEVLQSDLSGAVNVGSGQPVAVRDMVATVAALLGRPDLPDFGALPYRADDPMFICANAERLKQIGWTPRFDLSSGLADTLQWWRQREAGR